MGLQIAAYGGGGTLGSGKGDPSDLGAEWEVRHPRSVCRNLEALCWPRGAGMRVKGAVPGGAGMISVSSCWLVTVMWCSPVLVYAESSPPAPCGLTRGCCSCFRLSPVKNRGKPGV